MEAVFRRAVKRKRIGIKSRIKKILRNYFINMKRNRPGILGKADKLLVEIKKLSILLNYPQGIEKEKTKKLIVRRCEKLINLGENVNEDWKNVVLEDLKGDKEMWEAIQNSHNISQFKKLVGDNWKEFLTA